MLRLKDGYAYFRYLAYVRFPLGICKSRVGCGKRGFRGHGRLLLLLLAMFPKEYHWTAAVVGRLS